MRRLATALLLALGATAASAAPPAPPPRLVIVLAIDGLAADLFDEYRPLFFGGFGRLARGTVFRIG